MPDRLYYADSYLRTFDADVIERVIINDRNRRSS